MPTASDRTPPQAQASHMHDAPRTAMRQSYIADEEAAVRRLADMVRLDASARERVSRAAAERIEALRGDASPGLMEVFLAEYGLSTREGVSLMCLAEALLRVPDETNINALIRDKIAPADWARHVGHSSSPLVNASTWGLMLTGKVIGTKNDAEGDVLETLHGLVRRLGEPVIRRAVHQAMGVLGHQFVLGRDIGEALKRAREREAQGYQYSYDMLGEAARTAGDAREYYLAYANAISAIADHAKADEADAPVRERPGISIKLSALHPRYEATHRERVLEELTPRLASLALYAKNAGIGLNIDAEEADRLDLSLDVIEHVLSSPDLKGWDGFGVVVQAYGPRASYVLDWLYQLAERLDRKLMVRLVKGAYWDTEIKRAQVLGLDGYPVFTRKVSTDVSFMACAQKLLDFADRLYPQFATHNAHTAQAVLEMAEATGVDKDHFEFQRLHGMGEALHELLRKNHDTRCRIYAPVGVHEDLLAYLVRRLLENGANSSFVNQVLDEDVAVDRIARDPLAVLEGLDQITSPRLPLPAEIFGEGRRNAKGWDVTDPIAFGALDGERSAFRTHAWQAQPLVAGEALSGTTRKVFNPAKPTETVGEVLDGDADVAKAAIAAARAVQPGWASRSARERGDILRAIADLYEAHAPELMALATREAGKSIHDGIAEVREAVDFCRYYASEAERLEREGGRAPRGVFVCISPWNFPLAIFTGQITAALAAGNAVVAKPAEQTSLMAARAVELMMAAGVPGGVINLVPGDGASVGQALVSNPDVDGVCFTGSTETAQAIHRAMASDGNARAPLIAETGGLNAMVVDSTALPEQAVRDIVASAFQSAGQRCSALRLLCVQRDVAPKVLEMLKGAMDELSVTDPWSLETDVGPVIDQAARAGILEHCQAMEDGGRMIHKTALNQDTRDGHFVAPVAYRLDHVSDLTREIFGPVLHVVEFDVNALDTLIDDINANGFGLTFGLHTRIDQRVEDVAQRVHVGNAYVNRNQIGAVVGSQPFGGEGLSGTGPKAGGPNYVRRFTVPQGREAKSPAFVLDATTQAVPERLIKAMRTGADAMAHWQDPEHRRNVLRRAAETIGGDMGDAMERGVEMAADMDFSSRDLPGPTGESNQLRVLGRGVFLALGGTDAVECALALACGCALVVEHMDAAVLNALKDAGMADGIVQSLDAVPELAELTHLPGLDGLIAPKDDDQHTSLRDALAARAGEIVQPIFAARDPGAYVLERALCVDVTATGGNAALLAMVGDEA